MRDVVDHDVDRLGVEAWQHVKLTSTNHSIGFNPLPRIAVKTTSETKLSTNQKLVTSQTQQNNTQTRSINSVHRRPGGHGEGRSTRSHPELGSESLLRRWYSGLSHGRVGHRQVFNEQSNHSPIIRSPVPDPKITNCDRPNRDIILLYPRAANWS